MNNSYAQNTSTINSFDIIDLLEAYKVIKKKDVPIHDSVIIAVIDKGVNLKHKDLIKNLWTNKNEIPYNGIDDDNNGFVDDIHGWNFANNTNDVSIKGLGNWHGTPVNGIIGADFFNKIGVKGICPNVKLMNIVKDESIESIISSLNYVYKMRKIYNETNGQKGEFIVAVNCSWGKDSLWATDYPEWCEMYDSLGSVGVLCISSVPNDNIDIDLYGDMPSTCSSNYLITVSNSNQYDKKVYDAGFGRYSVDLAAPGDNTYTTLNSSDYGFFNGTSAAAPYVTGVIGLLYLLPSDNFYQHIKQNPLEVASLIKSVIISGVDKVADFENITVSGGRLNAFKSLKLLCDYYGEQYLYENLFESLKIISVYPNPATIETSLFIECNSNLRLAISISEINGKKIFLKNINTSEGISSIPIDLSGIHKGFYIINVTFNQTTKSVKLMIQ